MKKKTTPFKFEPAEFIPFRDRNVLDRVRSIKREDIAKHPNKDYQIRVIPDADFGFIWLNEFGFGHAFKKYFWSKVDPKLRQPLKQVIGPTNKNIKVYGKMLADLGGADVCYSGPGWTGHLAFIEPTAPEFAAASLEEWKQMSARVCTLHPLTIAQNSLHGSFGSSGDLCAVPPKAATIGPAEVVAAKHRVQNHALSIGGTFSSWQRLVSRLVMHGPVTPLVPESLLQTLRTDVWVSETAAANIEPRWERGY